MERKLHHPIIKFVKSNFFYLLFILFVGLILFSISFRASIYGDEWKIFWLGKSAIETRGNILKQQSTDLSYLFEILVFNILSKFAGYDGRLYYIFSLLCRLFATYSLFWFLLTQKMSKSAAFMGSLLFIVSPIGIETTDWVRNFDTYLSIPLFLVMLNISLNLKNKVGSIKIIILLIIITLLNTTRSPGVFVVLFGFLLYRAIFNSTSRKISFYAAIFALLIYLFVSLTPIFGAQTAKLFDNFILRDFVYSFFGAVGNIVLPNVSSEVISFKVCFFIGVVFFGIILLFSFIKSKRWTLKNNNLIFVTLLISFSPILTPLIRIPQIHASSEHRYLMYSALTVPILLSLLINRFKKSGAIFNLTLIMTFVLVMIYTKAAYGYLDNQTNLHSQYYTNSVWDNLKKNLDKYDADKKLISVIILTDRETVSRVNNSVAFGFNFHFGLIYEIWDDGKLPPVWVIEGKVLNKSTIPSIVFSPDRKILVFEIKGDTVTDLTPTAKL